MNVGRLLLASIEGLGKGREEDTRGKGGEEFERFIYIYTNLSTWNCPDQAVHICFPTTTIESLDMKHEWYCLSLKNGNKLSLLFQKYKEFCLFTESNGYGNIFYVFIGQLYKSIFLRISDS